MTGRDEQARLVELAKRRGFFFGASEVYGGVAGFYTYGPQGSALKRNVENEWRELFVTSEGNLEVDAPDVMPEPVFEASGHLDGFDDMIVECPGCGSSHRADHLVEDATDVEEAESLPIPEVEELIAEHDIACPDCGGPLAGADVSPFNLMFQTNIGPGSSSPGYLRPETAQGIFVEFPRLKEYARGRLPFGVGQIGKAWRNEISPRRQLVRVREFTQAELELFYDPERDSPPIERVADVELPLYDARAQEEGGETRRVTVGDAVADGTIASEWVAYYLGLAHGWYREVGIDPDRLRYRQHLPGELAHYATDCWDAEAEIDGNWIEITGFATRGSYDLQGHADNSGESFTVFQQYDEPVTVERATIDPDMSYLGPEFGGAAGDVAAALERLATEDRSAFEGDAVTVEVGDETYTVPVEHTGFQVEETTESGEHVTPSVVEPSFGLDRVIYAVLTHAYREDVVDSEERTYLALPPAVAPTTAGVFPLMDKDGLGERAREVAERLRAARLSVSYDDSGAIGRRYRRQDEVGTPYCVTVDYQSLEDDTVTLRDRDTTEQVRVPVEGLSGLLGELRAGDRSFDSL